MKLSNKLVNKKSRRVDIKSILANEKKKKELMVGACKFINWIGKID